MDSQDIPGFKPLPKPIDIPSKRDMTREEMMRAEQIIGRGKQTFIEVGEALTDIRDRKGWRFGYDSFEDYCRRKWGWTGGRARQLMGASALALDIKSVTNVTLENEAQARELKQIPREQLLAKLQPAVESGDPKAVREAVREIVTEHREERKPAPSDNSPRYAKLGDIGPDATILGNSDDDLFEAVRGANKAEPLREDPFIRCYVCGTIHFLDRPAKVIRVHGQEK